MVFDVRLAGTGLGRISVAASIGGLVIAIAGCGLADWRRWPTPSWPLASVRQSGESGEPELLARARTGSPLSPDEQRKLVATLQTDLAKEPSAWRRGQYVLAVGPIPLREALAVIQQGLNDPEPRVRMAACDALSQRPPFEAIPLLSATLSNDADLDVRLAAARGLGKYRDSEAVLALAAALDDPDPAIQYQVVQSLKDATGEDLGNNLSEWKKLAAGLMVPAGTESISEQPAANRSLRR